MVQRLVTAPPIRGILGLRLSASENRAASIRMVPSYLLNEGRKLYLASRAMMGEDVRAWCDWAEPEYIGRWWLWDGAAWDEITLKFGKKTYLGRAL